MESMSPYLARRMCYHPAVLEYNLQRTEGHLEGCGMQGCIKPKRKPI